MFAIIRIIEHIMIASIISLIIQIIVGAIVYLTLCLIYTFVTQNELYEILKKLFKR